MKVKKKNKCKHLIASFQADSFDDHYYKCLDCGEKIR